MMKYRFEIMLKMAIDKVVRITHCLRCYMTNITYESPSVQSYLNILQSIISRMAANSSGCKTWCITLVSAIIPIIADKGKPAYLKIKE